MSALLAPLLRWLDRRIDARIQFAAEVRSARAGLGFRTHTAEFKELFRAAKPEVRAAAEKLYLARGNTKYWED